MEMKRFLIIICAFIISGFVLSAQEKDTLVVIVKHEHSGNTFFEKVGKPFKKGYKAIEDRVVNGFQAVEYQILFSFAFSSSPTNFIVVFTQSFIKATMKMSGLSEGL